MCIILSKFDNLDTVILYQFLMDLSHLSKETLICIINDLQDKVGNLQDKVVIYKTAGNLQDKVDNLQDKVR